MFEGIGHTVYSYLLCYSNLVTWDVFDEMVAFLFIYNYGIAHNYKNCHAELNWNHWSMI